MKWLEPLLGRGRAQRVERLLAALAVLLALSPAAREQAVRFCGSLSNSPVLLTGASASPEWRPQ